MTDISTKKTIEIWDEGASQYYKIEPCFDGNFIQIYQREDGVQDPELHMIEIPADAVGKFNRALLEAAENIIENTKEYDAEG
jgi:hypothetical protein